MDKELIREIHKYLDYIPDDLKPKPNELVGLLQRAYVELCKKDIVICKEHYRELAVDSVEQLFNSDEEFGLDELIEAINKALK